MTTTSSGIARTSSYSIDSQAEKASDSGTIQRTLAATSNDAASGTAVPSVSGGTIANAPPPLASFDGGSQSDIVWRNTNGDAGIWLTNADGSYTPVDFGVIDNSWTIQGVGDFNGDGKADILWRNANGDVGEWLSNTGAGYTGFTSTFVDSIDPSWQIQGVGDFDGDGYSDILFRQSNGDTGLWLSNPDGSYTPFDFGVVDNSWKIQGVGDFDGDGMSDILWRNTNGDTGVWLTNADGSYTPFDFGVVDNSWKIRGVGDFNGDGQSDILWRNTNGDTGIWLINTDGSYTPVDFGAVDASWTIQTVGDYNGDGKADILWRNTNGQVGEWLSTAGAGLTGFTTPILASIDPNWVIQGNPPALQGGTGMSATRLAHAMAAMGASTASATVAASTEAPLTRLTLASPARALA
ncbi:MAG: repeat protein [Caulobacteraceae bacterium]|nr:repeat protein [Caulobacteraceae bacterium]